MSLKLGVNIRHINDYYPYGLTWSRPEGDDARMYQNKQWQQNEWGEGRGLEMYDFHARMGVYPDEGRNPVLARWHAPDPMNQFDSPYNAMGNNPVVNIDPDGMKVPWTTILSILSNIQITETVKHCTNAARMTFENINVSKNLFGQFAGVMDVAGGLLAFGQGSKILSEGQMNAGKNAFLPSIIKDRPPLHNEYAALYITNTSVYVDGVLQSSGSSYLASDGNIYNTGQSTFTGRLSTGKVSIVDHVIQINSRASVHVAPVETITHKRDVISFMTSDPWEYLVPSPEVSDITESYIQNATNEYIVLNANPPSEARFDLDFNNSEITDVTFTFTGAITNQEKKLIQSQRKKITSQLKDQYGGAVKIRILFDPSNSTKRVNIESTRNVYSPNPSDKYYNIFINSSEYVSP